MGETQLARQFIVRATGPSEDGVSWPVSVEYENQTRYTTLRNPFSPAQEASLRWYLEDYALHDPFQTDRAVAVAKSVDDYARSLSTQLGLIESVAAEAYLTDLLIFGHNDDFSIHVLHWETLRVSSSPLPISVRRMFKPELAAHEEIRNSLGPKLEVLVVTARCMDPSAQEVDPYIVLESIFRAFPQEEQHVIEFTVVRPGTFAAFCKHLAHPGSFQVVHFDLHGFSKRSNAYLQFTDPDDPSELIGVAGTKIAKVLQEGGVKTVVLNSCESARQSHGTSSNIAACFLRQGVSSVIGMSYKLLLTAAEIFVRSFYRPLCRPDIPVSQAALHASRTLAFMSMRKARFRREVSVSDFIVPVLYQNESSLDAISPKVTWMLLKEMVQEISGHSVDKPDSEDEDRPAQSVSHQVSINWKSETLFGRSFDLAVFESKLLLSSNLLELRGDMGVGKTFFLTHSIEWWKQTRLVNSAVYVDLESCLSPTSETITDNILNVLLGRIPQPPSLLAYSNPDANPDATESRPLNVPEHMNSAEKRSQLAKCIASGRYLIVLDHIDCIYEKLSEIQRHDLRALIMTLAEVDDDSQPDRFVVVVARDRNIRCLDLDFPRYKLPALSLRAAEAYSMAILAQREIEIELIDENRAFFLATLKLLRGNVAALKAIFTAVPEDIVQPFQRLYFSLLMKDCGPLRMELAPLIPPVLTKAVRTIESSIAHQSTLSPWLAFIAFNDMIPKGYLEFLAAACTSVDGGSFVEGDPLRPKHGVPLDFLSRYVKDYACAAFICKDLAFMQAVTALTQGLLEQGLLTDRKNIDSWQMHPVLPYIISLELSNLPEDICENAYRLHVDFHCLKANYWRRLSLTSHFATVQDLATVMKLDHTDVKDQYLNYIIAALVSGKVQPSGYDHSSDIIMLLGNWANYGSSTPSSIYPVTALTRKKLDLLNTKLDLTHHMSRFKRFRMFLEVFFVSKPRTRTTERYLKYATRQADLQDAITMSLFLCQLYLTNGADEPLATEIDRTVRLGLALSRDYPLGTEYNAVLGLIPMYKGIVLFKLGRLKESRSCLDSAIRILKTAPNFNPTSEWALERSISMLLNIEEAETGQPNTVLQNLGRSEAEMEEVRKAQESLWPVFTKARKEALGFENSGDVPHALLRVESCLSPSTQSQPSLQSADLVSETTRAYTNLLSDRLQGNNHSKIIRDSLLASLQVFLESEDSTSQTQVYHMLADEAHEQGRLKECLAHLISLHETLVARGKEMEFSSFAATCLNSIGGCAILLDENDIALSAFYKILSMTPIWSMTASQKRILMNTLASLISVVLSVSARALGAEDIDYFHFTAQLLALLYDPEIYLAPEYRTLPPKQKGEADVFTDYAKDGRFFNSLLMANNSEFQKWNEQFPSGPEGISEGQPGSSAQSNAVEDTFMVSVCPTLGALLGIPSDDLAMFFLHVSECLVKAMVGHENDLDKWLFSEPLLGVLREAEWVLFSDRLEKRKLKYLDKKWEKKCKRTRWAYGIPQID